MEPFDESNMTFGPFEEGRCFRIEQSKTYKAIRDGIKMAEFLLLRVKKEKHFVWIVEAKQSAPRPKNNLNFDKYIGDIRDKLANALELCIASILKRHANSAEELPELFKNIDLSAADFRLILIINGHQKEWLQPLQDALRKALRSTVKIWSLGPNSVAVINQEDALSSGLISQDLSDSAD